MNPTLLISCHGCRTPHMQSPGEMLIDTSLTIHYRCKTTGEIHYHTMNTVNAAIALNNGVPLHGVPDTPETITQ